jgi:hypothetical protein
MFTVNNAYNPYQFPVFRKPDTLVTFKYVLYSINPNFGVPYVSFYLRNENNILSFPEIPEHLSEPNTYRDTLLHIEHIMRDYNRYMSHINPMGYVYGSSPYKKEITTIYLFYNIQLTNFEPDSLSTETPIWPVVFWEIFHTGKVLSKVIDVEIPMVCRAHLDIKPFPSDTEDDPLSTLMYPMVGYTFHTKSALSFSAMFGASRLHTGPFGSYFYYYKDLFYSTNSEIDTSDIRGCVRYVIFANVVVYDALDLDSHPDAIAEVGNYILATKHQSANPITSHIIKPGKQPFHIIS